jgi:hypothetical protein
MVSVAANGIIHLEKYLWRQEPDFLKGRPAPIITYAQSKENESLAALIMNNNQINK